MLAIRLPTTIERRLERLAKRTGRTKTFYAREALVMHLDELEDAYLSIERLETPAKRWTLEELENDSDLDR